MMAALLVSLTLWTCQAAVDESTVHWSEALRPPSVTADLQRSSSPPPALVARLPSQRDADEIARAAGVTLWHTAAVGGEWFASFASPQRARLLLAHLHSRRRASSSSSSPSSLPSVWYEPTLERRRRAPVGESPERRRATDSAFTIESLKDPMFKHQWHLHNTRKDQEFHDLGMSRVWPSGYTGKGVVVTVVDDGLDHRHPDFDGTYYPEASTDINDHDDDPTPHCGPGTGCSNIHGTACAGEIAAQPNDVCGVGIAPGVRLGGIRMLDGRITDSTEGSAFSFRQDLIDIYSISWGPTDDGNHTEGPGRLAYTAIMDGIKKGRNGKGAIYVVASGDGGDEDDCNADGYANSPFTIATGSIGSWEKTPNYEEPCAAQIATTWSQGDGGGPSFSQPHRKRRRTGEGEGEEEEDGSEDDYDDDDEEDGDTDPNDEDDQDHTGSGDDEGMPESNPDEMDGSSEPDADGYYQGGDYDPRGIVTTLVGNSCMQQMGGTSASAPMMVGAVALMLQARPDFTWRDIQHCVVRAAVPVEDARQRHWKYSPNGVGLRFSRYRGFGVVHVPRLLYVTERWKPVGPLETCSIKDDTTVPVSIAKVRHTFAEAPTRIVVETTGCNAEQKYSTEAALEHVGLQMSFTHGRLGDVRVRLRSPMGTWSTLMNRRRRATSTSGLHGWFMFSVAFWGENPRGNWTLEIVDEGYTTTAGTLTAWKIVLLQSRVVADHPAYDYSDMSMNPTPATLAQQYTLDPLYAQKHPEVLEKVPEDTDNTEETAPATHQAPMPAQTTTATVEEETPASTASAAMESTAAAAEAAEATSAVAVATTTSSGEPKSGEPQPKWLSIHMRQVIVGGAVIGSLFAVVTLVYLYVMWQRDRRSNYTLVSGGQRRGGRRRARQRFSDTRKESLDADDDFEAIVSSGFRDDDDESDEDEVVYRE